MTGSEPHRPKAASIQVRSLSYVYPNAPQPALKDVGFQIEPGERVGLLGPNGAGKSTLMRILCAYLPLPDDGRARVRVAGYDVRDSSIDVRRRVGYLPEQVPLYRELRVREHLEFRATTKGVRRKARPGEIERVAQLTGIDRMLETPIHALSRGYRQRVGIADALLGAPSLVVLDEPTVGLDPNQVRGIRQMLRELGGSQTLLFSSHILAEVEALCDRIVVLADGEVVADESVREALTKGRVLVEWDASAAEAAMGVERAFASVAAARAAGAPVPEREGEGRARVRADESESVGELAALIGRACAEHGVALRRLEPGRRRLEERFARVTGFLDQDEMLEQSSDRPLPDAPEAAERSAEESS